MGCVMLQRLPDLRQDKPWECGRAAIRTILGFHGIVAPVTVSTPQDGTDPREVEAFFRRLHMPVVSGSMEIEDLKHFCNSRRPPIVLVHPPEYADSHYVCVRGVGRGAVFVQDPELGPRRISMPDWTVQWHATGRFEPFKHWTIVSWLP